jgi:hypothetical protein
MKKLFKLLLQLLALVGFIAGMIYVYKQYITKDKTDDTDEDFYDDFEFDDEDFTENSSDSREYVTLNSINSKTMPPSTEE